MLTSWIRGGEDTRIALSLAVRLWARAATSRCADCRLVLVLGQDFNRLLEP